MTVDRGKANRASLEAQLKRIIGDLRVTDSGALGPPVRCVKCRDTGVECWVKGEFTLRHGRTVEASEDSPVYTQCECVRRSEDTPKSRRYSAA